MTAILRPRCILLAPRSDAGLGLSKRPTLGKVSRLIFVRRARLVDCGSRPRPKALRMFAFAALISKMLGHRDRRSGAGSRGGAPGEKMKADSGVKFSRIRYMQVGACCGPLQQKEFCQRCRHTSSTLGYTCQV